MDGGYHSKTKHFDFQLPTHRATTSIPQKHTSKLHTTIPAPSIKKEPESKTLVPLNILIFPPDTGI